jgi:hypothetical protein
MTTGSHSADRLDRQVLADLSTQPEQLPDVVPFTAPVLRAARAAGSTVTEHRASGWVYMVISRREQMSVYKLIGPRFDHGGYHYRGHRTAAIGISTDIAEK